MILSLLYSSVGWYCMHLYRQIQLIFETICGINKKQTIYLYIEKKNGVSVSERKLSPGFKK